MNADDHPQEPSHRAVETNGTIQTHAPLQRVVGLRGAVWLGLGSILGTGVFVSLAIAAAIAGPGLLPALLLAALLAAANALSSAQLAAAFPVSGGTYEYAHRLIHPAAGFVAGWMFLAAKSASAASAAIACSAYLLSALGAPDTRSLRTTIALLLVLVLTTLVAGGVRRSERANLVMVSITVASLLGFVAAGAYSIDPTLLTQRLGASAWLGALDSPSALLHATAVLFVAYTGYGRIATLGEEVRDPETTIPRAIVGALGLALLLYLAVALTAVAAVGAEAFGGAGQRSSSPLEWVARRFLPPGVSIWLSVGAITAMAGVLLNLLLGLSRVLFAMARRREMPAWLDAVHASSRSPARAIWAMGLIIAAFVAIGDLQTNWSFSAFTVLIYYGITNLAALRLAPPQRRYPAPIAWTGLVGCVGLAFFVPWQIWQFGAGLLVAGFLLRSMTSARTR